MTENGESGQSGLYYCEILNAPETIFLESAQGISRDREDLQLYAARCQVEAPGLYQHLGGWLGVIRKSLELVARPEIVEMTDGAMTTGALMTYELLSRVAKRTGQQISNPPFDPADFIDSESPAHEQLLQEGRTLDLSRRAQDMPERFPILFQANLVMLAETSGRDLEAVNDIVYSEIDGDGTFPYEAANFLAGSAEIVLPLERYAQVAALEANL